MWVNIPVPWMVWVLTLEYLGGFPCVFFIKSDRAITWILFVLVGKAGFENLNTNNAAPNMFRKVNQKFIYNAPSVRNGSVRSPTVLCILFCRQCSVYDPCRHNYVKKSLPLKQPKAQNLLKHSGETHFAGNGCWHRLCHCSECCGDWHRN